ncbi:MAG: hypothetical protein U9N33_08110, partial [Campylobacterota bacterium]|nr:hypothetical protein [Campylobacterota bacterium]
QRGDGVTIVDIDDPLNMVEVSNLSDIGDCFDLKINADDSRVFVAGNNTLYVIDISNVTNPTLLGTLDGLSSEVFSLAVIDNYIYTVSDADLLCVRID